MGSARARKVGLVRKRNVSGKHVPCLVQLLLWPCPYPTVEVEVPICDVFFVLY